ncbi:unnamed protein product [Rhizophagus irregularis]|nr:unnamed protein product [Rhizophagus irregularis]
MTTMATSYPYGFDARSSPKTNENLNGTWNKRFVTAVERLKIKESILFFNSLSFFRELALSFALIASRGVVPLPSDNVEASVKFRLDCEYR